MKIAQERFLRRAAWQFLLRYSICRLPVDVFALAGAMGSELHTYAETAARLQMDVGEMRRSFDPDGFVLWNDRKQACCIYYDASAPEGALRWTLMHELAHFALGHVRGASLKERTKSIETRQWMEKEADGFTRRVLCPSIVLHQIGAFTPVQIARCCGISLKAATYRAGLLQRLESCNRFGQDPLERQVALQFSDYIVEYQSNHADIIENDQNVTGL